MPVEKPFDIKLNGVGYLLAGRNANRQGARQYKRTKIDKAMTAIDRGNVKPGQRQGEILAYFDNRPASGWGQAYAATPPGRSAFGENVDYRWPGQVSLSPLITTASYSGVGTAGADPRGFAELPGTSEVYLAWGRYLVKFSPATPGTASSVHDFGAGNAISQLAVFDGSLFVTSYNTSTGAANATKRFNVSGTTIAAASDCAISGDGIAACTDTYGSVLYATVRSGGLTKIAKLASGADHTVSGNWAINVSFGEAGEVYRWLVGYGRQIYGGCPSGFYGFDQDRQSVNVLGELRSNRSTDNTKMSGIWHGSLYIPHIRGLYGFDGQVTSCGPVTSTTPRQDGHGRTFGYPVGLAGDADWLYLSTWNGTDTYIFAGREALYPETWGDASQMIAHGNMVWYTYLYLAGSGPYTSLFITGQTDPSTLLMASSAGIAYCELPLGNPLLNPLPVAATGKWYLPFHDFGYPANTKILDEVAVAADGLTSTETITPNYRMTETGGFTALSAVTTSGTSQFVDATGQGVQLRLDFARGATTTATPVHRLSQMKGLLRSDGEVTYEVVVEVADQQVDRLGNVRPESASTLLSNLEAFENSVTEVSFEDPWQRTYTVLMDGTVTEGEIEQVDQRPPMGTAAFKLVQVQV